MARKKAQTFHVSQIEDWQGPPAPTMPAMRPVASHEAGAPDWQVPVQAPQMRARSMGERVGDFVGSLVEQPIARVASIAPQLMSMIPRLPESPYVAKIAGDTGPAGENMVRGILDGGLMAASLVKPPARTLTNGLYSRLDEASTMLPKKGVPAPAVMNWLKKAPEGISLEEAAWRKLPEWLESQGTKTVTPEMLASHLKANPAPFPKVKTLGGAEQSMTALPEGYQVQPLAVGNRPGTQRNYTLVGPDGVGHAFYAENAADANDAALQMLVAHTPPAPRPKFPQPKYQVAGGENYRETLQTLPPHGSVMPFDEWVSRTQGGRTPDSFNSAALDHLRGLYARNPRLPGMENEFRSSHYGDDPNLLVHTRANDRTLPTGERGRFVEEVQSDWHQTGAKTDTPFKDTWPDLGLKQQLVEAANDPNAEWLGFTGGKTQADRYDLSKQVESIYAKPAGDGLFDLTVTMPDGATLYDTARTGPVTADQISDLVGKEMSQKVTSVPASGQAFTGLDLQVGGEGMLAFYDQKLPKRLEKIVKPFGGKVEPITIPVARPANRREELIRALQENDPNGVWSDADNIAEFGQPATLRTLEDAAQAQGIGGLSTRTDGEASWLSRLTPEMKENMRQRGFPLMGVAGPVAAQGIPDDPNSEADDYARLALNMGSAAALGMAVKGMAGKRMSAAEAEAAGLWHPVGEGKRLDVPVSEMRYQREPVPMRGVPDVKTLSPESMQGAAIIPAVGDRSIAGSRVTSINDIPLERPVIGEGGPGFMRTHDQYGTSWASESNAITKLANRTRQAAKESLAAGGNGNVFMVYMPTSHAAVDFSTMMTDALLEQAKAGKITKTGIKQFDARVRKMRPEWLGILHKDAQKQLSTVGELRHAFVDAMKVDEAARAGFPDLPTTRAALTEPALMDTPSYHGGFAVAKLDPSGRVVKDPLKPHTTYNTQLGGSYAGQLEKPVPIETLFSDFHAARRAGGKDPGRDIRSFMLSNPIQIATPKWVEANMKFLKSSGAIVAPVGAGTVLSALGEPDESKSWRDIRTHQKGKNR